ncbi:hypothetical protein DL764_007054 [Monosporascus ibericus]|uniref:F-box domain-containing protein n=1 Tax=Monosporascus ibericus TaxID=155417 RepID=A0A4V1X9W7_9PEZI|nr:hypothetical protein DL764_007054 [Monosporascus ibericus]
MKLLVRARHLPTILRSLWKRPGGKQNQDNSFLQFPPELICLVGEFLTPAQLALFSQTCRSLRATLGRRSNAAHLSRTEYFEYLAVRARGLPEQWVCERCMALHPIVKLDAPATRHDFSSCPLALFTTSRDGHLYRRSRGDSRLGYSQFRIDHHHVQLALKYTRLQHHKYNSYLQALMAPHHDMRFGPRAAILHRAAIPCKLHYSAYPKVVAGDDGNLRFLLLSTWRYHKGREDISLRNIGYQRICPHLELNDCTVPCLHGDPSHVLETAVEEALEARGDGRERIGACPRCATDFSVQLTSEYLNLHVWQDFGPEGSPVDLAWKSQSSAHGLDGVPNWRFAGPTLYHEPGTIRKLYGPEVPDEAVKPRNKPSVPVNYHPSSPTVAETSEMLLAINLMVLTCHH